ncbi:nucleotide exchange factor GrpE [Empedobacter falsenii]|uniref:Protein GrpE n=2 Tax=Weeksellaceae TaxID=2762318 RepID=A0A7H9DQJ9_9FLAO|nr:nucleotide exchange factor GrpE [Empedobacter brevis]MDM1063219.1 nucleotide exchange factor GrpE [Empedobacter falsenii]MDM1136543.1 nucleotide exchange factor GrpE [Empedobacter sp. R750]HAR71795.1 nucleotide exchange factor GrpE [Flavobacteriaceae bacterium]MDM1549684.1 nucleotide exchange factor GrpE [Empedobacter falsenii]
MGIGKLFDSIRNKKTNKNMSDQNIHEELENENLQENVQESDNTVEQPQEETAGKSELEIVKEQLAKEKDQYLRLFAEFDNFKKRTSRERMDIFKTANKEVITSLLPVLDDFGRAINQIEKSGDDNLLQGVELINNKLVETLRAKGLKEMEVKPGDDFNTDLHEAITQIPAPTEDLKGKIVDVVETGYLLNDVVVRYAKVVVGL